MSYNTDDKAPKGWVTFLGFVMVVGIIALAMYAAMHRGQKDQEMQHENDRSTRASNYPVL